ncbi:MAG: glycosyltransferase family 4 protein [Blastocatellia bacterium]
MKPLKVLHIVSVDKENYYLNNLVDHSAPESVEYCFVTFAEYCDFAKSLEDRGKKVYCLNAAGKKSYPKAAREIWKILKAEDPSVVHTHLFDPSLIGLTISKWQRRKTVLTRHHSDAIHQLPSRAKRKFYLALENYISRKADHIIAPSRMVHNYLVGKEGVPSGKVTIIPYGQTTDRFDAITPDKIEAVRAEFGIGKELSLVNVSRLFHRKGHKYLFEAFSDLVKDGLDATLYLVGEGDFRGELEAMCGRLGIAGRVEFLGWRNNALAIVAASDIVVHPSLEDALSSAVIEALMLEKPIVASDISGVRDSLDNGKYGEIVTPADANSFRKGLENILKNIEAARLRAKEGRKYLLEYMDAKRVSDAYFHLYTNLLLK